MVCQHQRTELGPERGWGGQKGQRGEIRRPFGQGQEEQLGVLGLALNSIVHWNAVYMQETVRQLSEAGAPPLPADIARLSPIFWRHINFLGSYDFSVPDAVANGGPRPLRPPKIGRAPGGERGCPDG